jgi:Na+-driven multidrug efflux pump
VPLAWFLAKPMALGPAGAFTAVPIAYSVFVAAALLMFRRGAWKLVKV